MTISWDAFSEEIHFVVDLPSDSLLALAFGSTQSERDMVLYDAQMSAPYMTDCLLLTDNTSRPDL